MKYMDNSIFDFLNYKPYLRQKLLKMSKGEKAFKRNTAKLIGCLPSYLSQILNGKPDLTLEQANKLNRRLLHDKSEAKFFIFLVEYSRANTHDLKEFFKEQMTELQSARFDLKKRLEKTDQISKEHMDRYYSSWIYAAVHMALALPQIQTAASISKQLNIPAQMASEIISFLEASGLVVKINEKYEFTKMRIHLDRDSHFIQRHHINWRSQSLQAVELNLVDNLHFSTLFAIQKSDFNQIKENFLKSIEASRAIIRPSEPEEVFAITLDLFKVGN